MKRNFECAFGMSVGILMGNVLTDIFFVQEIFLLEKSIWPDFLQLSIFFIISLFVSFLMFSLIDCVRKLLMKP